MLRSSCSAHRESSPWQAKGHVGCDLVGPKTARRYGLRAEASPLHYVPTMISNCHLPVDHSLDNRRFYELSVDLLATFGFDGFFKAVNPAWSATLGFSEAELLARPFIELAHPDDWQACGLEIQRLQQGCVTINFENRILCKDGSY